ncbi:mediator of RNA polymerase II transcription subunit 15a-like isoform X2 [Malania oleifera]|uniref:mediator of RNA polymerase II transcription subunit 15a-like isoform X2 n=2 Tax=Malania oleifera TaxID=397392 RepID=UPI0025AE3651|nr:mediator of RNA polymerase II transcription subunit 15a-like isoform X2 [Malania oleifera]
MESCNWRTQLTPGFRQKVLKNILEKLQKHVQSTGPQTLSEVQKIAIKFEERVYTAATSQQDYLHKISMKLQAVVAVNNNTAAKPLSSSCTCTHENPRDPASHCIQSREHERRQSPSIPLANQSHLRQQLLSQNTQNNIGSTVGQSAANPTAAPNAVGLDQNLQYISGILQDSTGTSMGQGVPSNSQSHMQGAPHSKKLVPQQHHQESQIWKKFHHEPQTHTQQQQQQNLSHPTRMQTSQQSVMQASSTQQPRKMQSVLSSGLQQNKKSSKLSIQSGVQQHPQALTRQHRLPHQAPVIHQQQIPMLQQTMFQSQQQQLLIGQQSNPTSREQIQSVKEQTCVPSIQSRLQSQQLLGKKGDSSNVHQHQWGEQSNVCGLQLRQQLLGAQSGDSSIKNQYSEHMLQQAGVAVQQYTQQKPSISVPTQGQQTKPQPSEQQALSRVHSKLAKIQDEPNPLQQELQTSSTLLWPQHLIEQQKQLFQPQNVLSEHSPSVSEEANLVDWREEVYQKIKSMKDMYLPKMLAMHQKVSAMIPQLKADHINRFKELKVTLDYLIAVLQLSKDKILPPHKEKLNECEKWIIGILNLAKCRNPASSLKQEQLSETGMASLQQVQESQTPKVQSHVDQMMTSSITVHQSNVKGLQLGYTPSISEFETTQREKWNSQQGPNLISEQENAVSSLRQIATGSQQIPGAIIEQENIKTLSQIGMTMSQPDIKPIHSNSCMHVHLEQKKDRQVIQAQLLKQESQQHQAKKLGQQQLAAQSRRCETPPRWVNEPNDSKVVHRVGVKSQALLHHSAREQLMYHNQQQLKAGASFPISSPQLCQSASPQDLQHCPLQIGQKNLQKSLTKTGSLLQSRSSLVVPSLPMLDQPDTSGENAGNVGHQLTGDALVPIEPFAISSTGISASLLLAEIDNADGNLVNASENIFRQSCDEKPVQHLVKLVNSISHEALSASVNDIWSVVSMMDMMAGSAPGNGSRAAVGEDLADTARCHLQAKCFSGQYGTNGLGMMQQDRNLMPSETVSFGDDINDRCDLESTATFCVKRPRIEAHYALLDEIREINQKLINTVVDIGDENVDTSAAAAAASEGGEGTIVKCSFNAVPVNPNSKSQHSSAEMSSILPLKLLVPTNYPNCSPILLEKLPAEGRLAQLPSTAYDIVPSEIAKASATGLVQKLMDQSRLPCLSFG